MIRADQVSEEWDDRPFGPMSRSGMARLYGRSTFSFLRILHSDSHGAVPVCNPTTMSEDSPFLMSSQAFVISYFLYLNHRMLVLICIYMIVKDVGKFLRYFLAVFISSFENSLL